MSRLILTNGDSAQGLLHEAGIADPIQPWRDVLHAGRVAHFERREDFIADRIGEVATFARLPRDEVAQEFEERENLIRDHGQFERIEIWLEHDLYDQLQLLDMLDALASAGRHKGVFLVQADDYLGHQTPDTVLRFAGRTEPVTEDMHERAVAAWNAFRGSDCAELGALANRYVAEPGPFAFLGAALIRFLAEFPDTTCGLGRTQRNALSLLKDEPTTAGRLFGRTQGMEAAAFLGDLGFFELLDRMADTRIPAVDGLPPMPQGSDQPGEPGYDEFVRSTVSLTPYARDLLEGHADFVTENGIDCWFGGYHACGHDPWRWDEAAQTLVAPA